MYELEDHILSNSPLFVGEYLTDRGNHVAENAEQIEVIQKEKRRSKSLASLSAALLLEESNFDYQPVKILQTGKGFNKSFTVLVYKEETFYNDNYKPYKVLFIDKCLSDVG